MIPSHVSAADITAVRPVTALGLTGALARILDALFGAQAGLPLLRVGVGLAAEDVRLALPLRGLPSRLVRELAYEPAPVLRLALATFREGPESAPVSTRAVAVELPLPITFDSRRRRWGVAPEAIDERTAALRDFPVPLSLLVDGGDRLVAVWLLRGAVDLTAELARVEALQRALAEALGGRTEDDVEARPAPGLAIPTGPSPAPRRLAPWSCSRFVVPVPGGASPCDRLRRPVMLVHANLVERVTLEALETAVSPKKRKGK